MRRREAILGIAAAAAAAGPARAHPLPVVGFLRSTPSAGFEQLAAAFREGLKQAGFVAGENVRIEYRFADDREDRLRAHAQDLVDRAVTLIVGDSVAVMAANAAPTSIPMVFATGGDPVRNGLVATLNRPGGKVTGVTFFGGELGPKRLELLRQVAPPATTIAVLTVPNNPTAEAERRDIEAAARSMGQELLVLEVASDRDLDTAFLKIVEHRAGALLVGAGTFLNSRRASIATFAARQRLPSMYSQREAVLAGGLMSYGTSVADAYRQAGIYAGRILKGEKPGDLPVVQNVKFEFVINTGTASALGLSLPASLLALADEAIE